MADHYRHEDMYVEHIFLGMDKISTQELHPELNLRYSIWFRSNQSHLTLNCFQLVFVFPSSQPNTFSKYEIDRLIF